MKKLLTIISTMFLIGMQIVNANDNFKFILKNDNMFSYNNSVKFGESIKGLKRILILSNKEKLYPKIENKLIQKLREKCPNLTFVTKKQLPSKKYDAILKINFKEEKDLLEVNYVFIPLTFTRYWYCGTSRALNISSFSCNRKDFLADSKIINFTVKKLCRTLKSLKRVAKEGATVYKFDFKNPEVAPLPFINKKYLIADFEVFCAHKFYLWYINDNAISSEKLLLQLKKSGYENFITRSFDSFKKDILRKKNYEVTVLKNNNDSSGNFFVSFVELPLKEEFQKKLKDKEINEPNNFFNNLNSGSLRCANKKLYYKLYNKINFNNLSIFAFNHLVTFSSVDKKIILYKKTKKYYEDRLISYKNDPLIFNNFLNDYIMETRYYDSTWFSKDGYFLKNTCSFLDKNNQMVLKNEEYKLLGIEDSSGNIILTSIFFETVLGDSIIRCNIMRKGGMPTYIVKRVDSEKELKLQLSHQLNLAVDLKVDKNGENYITIKLK